jgi:nitroreductase
MILAAEDFGLGTLWICDIFYSHKEICSWLNREEELVAAIAIGYPNQSPYPRPRKSVEEVAEWFD